VYRYNPIHARDVALLRLYKVLGFIRKIGLKPRASFPGFAWYNVYTAKPTGNLTQPNTNTQRGVRANVADGVVPMGSRFSIVSGQSERWGCVVKLHI
jgi:hypothetical protein